MDQIALLTQRVYRLEQEIARLKGAELEPIPAQIAATPAPTATAPTITVKPPPLRTRPETRPLESEVVGTWFARIGAIALLLGAGFAFKYGIDQGYIGPSARVVAGVAAGLALVGLGEWARRKAWPAFAQAVAAAGLATMVLSFWAAFHLYDLLPAGTTFAALVAVTGLAVWVALAHDSEALALLASFGAFINPLLVGGRDEPAALYGYVLVIDVGIVSLAAVRRWTSTAVLAAVASWILFGVGAGEATTGVALGYASAIFAIFAIATAMSSAGEESPSWKAILVAVNGVAYGAAGLALLHRSNEEAMGAFGAFVAAAHLVLGAGLQRLRPDRSAEAVAGVLSVAFLTTAVGFQWPGPDLALAWAVEAVVLAAAGVLLDNRFVRSWSLAVAALSVFTSLVVRYEGGSLYAPDQLLVSKEGLTFLVQIAALLVIAALEWRQEEEWERGVAGIALIGANALAIVWFSFEATAHYRGTESFVPRESRQALQFTLSAIWGLYAAALLAVGIAFRSKWVRLMAIALFGLTIGKMALADLWTLTTGFRVLGFLGLGAVLLTASLTYHRFREVIFGPGDAIGQAGQKDHAGSPPASA